MKPITNYTEYMAKSQIVQDLKKIIAEKEESFKDYHKELYEQYKDAVAEAELAKDAVRKEALALYEETDVKKFDEGVGIRVMKKLDYEASDALDWAKKHNLCLSLDKKAFENVAKANIDEFDFVKLRLEPSVTFPSNK